MCFSYSPFRIIRPIHALLTLAVLISASAAQKAAPQPASHPNLLLVTIDTLRPDHLRCYGYTEIETPSIDSLAADGIRFEQAYTPVPITLPSHTVMLTGTYPMMSGMHDFSGNNLNPEQATLATVLRARGYDTGAVIAAAVLDRRFGLNHGYASTPLLEGDRLYVQVLHGMKTKDPSYVFAVDKGTGKTIWKVERPTDAQRESPDNYATPQIARVDNRQQLVVSGADYVTGHDIDSGKELWRIGGFNPTNDPANRTIASSVVIGANVFTTSTRGHPFIAFRAGGSGNITGKSEIWKNNLGADVPTPTTDGKYLYVLVDNGILNCLEAATGKVVYQGKRIERGTYSASPLLADGKIYCINEEGTTTVVKAGPEFEVLAVNKLDGLTLASPVAVDDEIFIRTADYLYCIRK